jgi:hypothetical protein
MFAEIPQPLVDLGTLAGVFTACSIAIAFLWKTAPVKWLRAKLSESLGDWLKIKFTEATEVLIQPMKDSQALMKEDLGEIKKVVHHHLGHNGDSPKLHVTVHEMEKVLMSQKERQIQDDQDDLSASPYVD